MRLPLLDCRAEIERGSSMLLVKLPIAGASTPRERKGRGKNIPNRRN
jgi:hypothetical protein